MASARTTTDHEEIRKWAEERGGKPSCVKRTGAKADDPGIIRINFPGYSGEGSLEEISWDEWFQKFDANGLALLFQDETRNGEKSNFNKLVNRQKAAERTSGGGRAATSDGRGSKSGASSAGKAATKTGKAPARKKAA